MREMNRITITHYAALTIGIVLLTLAACFPAASDRPARAAFYVSTHGNDTWSGTRPAPNRDRTDGPFATMLRARDAIRSLKQTGPLPDGGITVWIRGGTYPLTDTFELTQQDSGTAGSPIVYQAYRDEEVRIIGGQQVTAWQPVTDPTILERLDPHARAHAWQANLPAQDITDFGELTARGFAKKMYPAGLELFFDGQPMTLARWPNEGWVTIAEVVDRVTFVYDGDRPQRWLNADDIWLHGYWSWDWADEYLKVASINPDKHEITLAAPHHYGLGGKHPDRRYYALNILEELDAPGEYYLDRNTGILYFWPPAPINEGHDLVSMLEEPMVRMQDVAYVTLRGLTIEVCRGTAVGIKEGSHNLLAGCTLRNIGKAAISIKGGTEHGVAGCDIYQTGDGGIRLSGGDRLTLTPGGHDVCNNHIHHYSRWDRTYRPAMLISGVGNRIAHNLIHDAPHSAIILHGNEHVIEYNEIHNVCLETSDAGAFYIGRDYSERGNIVRYNFIHHLGPGNVTALYLDDFASGTTLLGNICYKTGRGVLIGGGRDNLIENNLLVNCKPAVHIDARGLDWAQSYFDGRNTTLMDRLKAVNYTQPPYSTRYPELLTLYDDNPAMPKYNRIVRNVIYRGRWADILREVERQFLTIQDNLTDPDTNPGIVDRANMDFRLTDNSPAWDLGFQRIPLEKIGLYTDRYRRCLPMQREDE